MKALLLPALFMASASCFGQTTDAELKNRIDRTLANKLKAEKERAITTFPRLKPTDPARAALVQPGQCSAGVFALPGGMPCIVPDRTGIAAIPNIFGTGTVPYKTSIPNAHPGMQLPPGSAK